MVERGYHLPEKEREIIQARKSIEQSTIWNKVRPLFMRGAIAGEIALITNLSRKQVNNAIDRRIKKTNMRRLHDDFFTKETTRIRQSRSHKGKRKRLVDRPTMSEEEKNQIEFAKIAQEKGFFTDDLTCWNSFNSLYESLGRKLPPSFYERLRLEVFFSAIEHAKGGETTLLNNYAEIGKSIGLEWFNLLANEEGVIRAKLLTYWADGEDEKGFFQLNANGGKVRQVVNEDEGLINLNSEVVLKKAVTMAIQERLRMGTKGRSRR